MRSLFVFVALVLPAAAGPTLAPIALDALIAEVLDLSGTRRMLDQIRDQVRSSTARDEGRLPPDLVTRLRAAVADCYKGEALARTVTEYLRHNASHDQLASALELLRTPIALRFTELEVRAGAPEAQPALRSFLDRLPYSPPSVERTALLARLDELTGTSVLMTDVAVSTASAVARGVASASGPLTRRQRVELDDAVDEMRQQLGTTMREQVKLTLLFTYRDANDPELDRYVKLYESSAGQWLARAAGAAVRAALERAAQDLGRRLAGR